MQVVLASSNQGKLKEFAAMLQAANIKMLGADQFCQHDIPEEGATFVENAIAKARHLAKCSKMPCLADDSGLVVPALNGSPGILSARYAGVTGENRDACNNQKLLAAIKNLPRAAYFHCALAFLRDAHDPAPIIVQASWHGEIVDAPQGENGFAYDPIFYIPQLGKTAAQLSNAQKNQLSHRAKALAQLLLLLKNAPA